MHSSRAKVGFSTLPAELRNRIYKRVLIKTEGVNEKPRPHPVKLRKMVVDRSKGWINNPWLSQPALAQTTRAVREEALRIYYGSNHSIFTCRS